MFARVAVLLALPLSACAAPPMSAPSSLAPSRAAGPADEGERRIMAAHPGVVRRVGATLFIGRTELTDISCEVDVDSCVTFRARDLLIEGRLFGVDVGYYEGQDYVVATTESNWITTGEKPVFSPDARYLAAAVFNEAYETMTEGFHLWAVDGLTLRRRIVPEALSYTADLAWLGNACLSFTAQDSYVQGAAPTRSTWYVVADRPEWRLTNKRDARCP